MILFLLTIPFLIPAILAAPSARLKNALVIGSTTGTVETFLGIPYADPPVGNLRLRRPQPFSKPLGTFNATTVPRACPQKPATGDLPILQTFPEEVRTIYTSYDTPYPSTGEDCLTVNVQRPANTTADAKLPVLFWIYGGAWEDGATLAYDWTAFVAQSAALGSPVILVEANYRLNTFGFLGGKEVKADGISNLGLRDQRLALEWVHENIAAFGGDPEKVTLWGQSAGSVSVYNHLLINGRNRSSERTGKPLFSAGIMHSSTAFPADAIDAAQAQSTYDFIVSEAGCKAAQSTLECLRAAPYEKLMNATDKFPLLFSPAGLHFNFVPRPDPSDNFFTVSEYDPRSPATNHIADVPLIVGHQEDESTIFIAVSSDVTNQTALVSVLQANFPHASRPLLDKFITHYRGDEATGAPFRTNASQNAYPHSKINSAVVTDIIIFPIRYFLQTITSSPPAVGVLKRKSPVWAFQGAYMHGFPFLGTFHGSDLVLFARGEPASVFADVVGRYVRFATTGSPNTGLESARQWPTYGVERQLLRFNVNGTELIKDDFRWAAYEYWKRVKGMLKY